jgi:signal transduction histidine kinase
MARSKRIRPASNGGVKSATVRAALRALFGESFDGMVLLDRRDRIVEANVPASRLLSLPLEGIIGKRLGELVKVRHRSVVPRQSAVPVDAPHAAGVFLTLERRDKSLVDIVVHDVRNVAPGVCIRILRDVTAEGSVMEALEKKTRLLEESERVGRIGAWEVDVKAGIVMRTPEMCRMMEVTMANHTGTIEDSYRYYSESSRPIIREAMAAAMARGTPYDLELEMLTARGNRLWIREVCCATMRKGRLVSLFGIAQDIDERRRLAELVADAANQERARLGADLHDGLGQDLTGLALLLKSAATRAESDSPNLAHELGELARLASKAVQTARAMAHGMLPVGLTDGGLTGAFQRLSHSTHAAFGVAVTVRYRGDPQFRPNGIAAETVYRIAQEAIANAVKHGQPKRISVFLGTSETQTVLIVSNNGDRIDPERTTEGMGLQIMRYRARMLGGFVDVHPIRKGGTRVRCVVPRNGLAEQKVKTE